MTKPINTFIVTGKIETDYFYDWAHESARLIKSLVNGNKMVIIELFKSIDRSISKETVERVYHLFKGHTYYIQKTFNKAFYKFIKKHSLSSASSIQSAINKLLEKDLITELNNKYAVTE